MMNDSCGDDSIVADATRAAEGAWVIPALKGRAELNLPLRGTDPDFERPR